MLVATVRKFRTLTKSFVLNVLSFVYSAAKEDKDLDPESVTPDLIFWFKSEDIISKVIGTFQSNGFAVTELGPKVFSFLCKFEVLLHQAEKLGWKRMTKS